MKEKILAFMTWTTSISCLSFVVDFEENLFEGYDKNAPLSLSRLILKRAPITQTDPANYE